MQPDALQEAHGISVILKPLLQGIPSAPQSGVAVTLILIKDSLGKASGSRAVLRRY